MPLAPGLPCLSLALHADALSCLQALEVLTSSVEYGLQDLCKVRPYLDWGRWSLSAPMLRSTPRWSLQGWWLEAGGGSEDSTVVHHPGPSQAQPLLLNPGGSLRWDPP